MASSISFRRVSLVSMFCLATFVGNRGAGAQEAPLAWSKSSEATDRIYRALSEQTSVEFTETPLADVVEYLKDVHKIEIQLDTKALEEASIGTDMPVTRNVKGISLKSALTLILRPLNLTYVIENEVLLITSVDGARTMVSEKVYDVAALVGRTGQAADLAKALEAALQPKLVARAGAEPTNKEGGIAPSNSDDRGEVVIVPFRTVLIVRASFRGQLAVQELLGELQDNLRDEAPAGGLGGATDAPSKQ